MNDLLDQDELPDWFAYPEEFLQMINSAEIDLGPWQLLLGKWLRVRHEGLTKRFPARGLVPFARRLDNDDVACWDRDKPGKVCVVHDFSAPGWEERTEHSSFQEWYQSAKRDAADYE